MRGSVVHCVRARLRSTSPAPGEVTGEVRPSRRRRSPGPRNVPRLPEAGCLVQQNFFPKKSPSPPRRSSPLRSVTAAPALPCPAPRPLTSVGIAPEAHAPFLRAP